MTGSSTAVRTSPPCTKDQLHVTRRVDTTFFQKEASSTQVAPSASSTTSSPRPSNFSNPSSSSSSSSIATVVGQSDGPFDLHTKPKSRSVNGVCSRSTQSIDYRQVKQTSACDPCTRRRPRSHTQLDRPTTFLIAPLHPHSANADVFSAPSPLTKTAPHHPHSHAQAHGRDRERDRERDGERPTRSSSSPQLIRTRNRARSSSASSSASLTATEESFSYAYERMSASTSASSARLQANYPSMWPFVAPPQAHTSASGPNSSSTLNLRNRRYTNGEITASSPSEDSGQESEDVEQELIFVSSTNGHSSSNARISRKRKEEGPLRLVTTARGMPCAGETETELDEIPVRLPTSRKIPNSEPLIVLPINVIISYLFQACRLLSIVPAVFGTLYNIHHAVYRPMPNHMQNTTIDYVVCALWAILTGLQCLRLTTGLLHRWKAYYATLSTLIRLVALQAICWPATHLTLKFFDHAARPVVCWTLIGTTTCISRSIQLWVTSNLYLPPSRSTSVTADMVWRDEGRLGPRRWDWRQVGVKCVLPAGILYFITAWALLLKGELGLC